MNTFQLSNNLYEKLKLVTRIILPGIATLYFTLANIWDWSNAEEVVGTIAAITLFLGGTLQISNRNYNNDDSRFAGDLTYTFDTSVKSVYSLELSGQPEDLVLNEEANFKVVPGIHGE